VELIRIDKLRPRERDGFLQLLGLADRVLGERASKLDKYLYLNGVLGRVGRDPAQRARLRVELYEALYGELDAGDGEGALADA
jgi:hypothetical protein